jgi:uncharacterized protein YodC (DUF2158 family)
MEEQKFKRGDVVRLKSGSPKMTVAGYDPEDGANVTCTWFSNKELQEQSFHQDLLDAYVMIDINDLYHR